MTTIADSLFEVELWRVYGAFVDAEGVSWYRGEHPTMGSRDVLGQAIYTDGVSWATRAGSMLSSRDIEATELTGGKA